MLQDTSHAGRIFPKSEPKASSLPPFLPHPQALASIFSEVYDHNKYIKG